jgi:hypothetical protein
LKSSEHLTTAAIPYDFVRTGNNLSKAGWSWGCVAAVDRKGWTIWVVAAERDGQRFIVHADEKLTAFVELESAIYSGQRLAAAIG